MNVPNDKYIRVGTINTRYWDAGEGDPILLLHGGINSVEDWLLNFHEFAQTHRVIAVDLIGHGKTDKPISGPFHFDDLALFVVGFMDALELERATLIGHSLGGWITLKLAIEHPSYVQKVILVDSGGLGKEAPITLRLLTLPVVGDILISNFLNMDFDAFLKMQRENWPESELITDELIRLKYEAIINPKNKKSLLKGMRSFITFFGFKKHTYQPIIDGLSSIEKPLLTFWGREDDTLPVAWTQKIAEACPQAQIEIFDACGHDPMVEKSVAFNQIVLDFLSDSQGKRMTLNQI